MSFCNNRKSWQRWATWVFPRSVLNLFIFYKIIWGHCPPKSRQRHSELIPNQFNGENVFFTWTWTQIATEISHCATNDFVTNLKKKKEPKTDKSSVPITDPQPASLGKHTIKLPPEGGGALTSLPPHNSFSIRLHSVLCQKIWPLRWQMSWGHVGCGPPPVASSHRQHKRGLSVIMGFGTVPIQGTGHHLWYTNTTAYFRRLERVPSLSFKTFICLFFTSHHICTQTRLNYLSFLGLTAQTTENKYLPADDK